MATKGGFGTSDEVSRSRDSIKDWEPILQELAERRASSRAMGGPERIERLMTQRGKLDARRRIELLFDPGTFVEIGPLAGSSEAPADALVAGMGKIHGRPVLAGAEDFTVLGGSIGNVSMAKRYRICELATQERMPLIFMLDGAGHRLTETESPGRAPNDLLSLADLSGQVPMVCLVLGASAGHGALTAPLSDLTIITESAAMFTAGPPLVKAGTGEDVTKEELGGPQVCADEAGVAHNVVADDEEAIAMARRYLEYLPAYAGDSQRRREAPDTGPRLLDDILGHISPNPRRVYAMRPVLKMLVDEGSLFEVQPRYGASILTALGFIGGRAVAIVANDPSVRSGSIDSAAAIKAADFIDNVGAFGLPFLFLADNPGVMAGTAAERSGILKWAGKMYKAQRRLTSPKIHVTLRKAFGFGTSIMAQNPFDRQTLCYALPTVTLGAMPADSGGKAAKLDDEERARLVKEQSAGAWKMAARLGYDDILDPRELRNGVLNGLSLLDNRLA
ncbi:MAG: carboxyl transferase domain-containing protein [Candidatus Binatia bacterium]|nr:carboxyl transferase domain-containing protein [Candidatus Binatia bacterium]